MIHFLGIVVFLLAVTGIGALVRSRGCAVMTEAQTEHERPGSARLVISARSGRRRDLRSICR